MRSLNRYYEGAGYRPRPIMIIFLLFGSFLSTAQTRASELDGKWIQNCFDSFERIEKISGHQAQLIETSFLDSSCAVPQLSIISSGMIHLGKTTDTPPGAFKIDFTFEKVEITPHSRQAADFYNSHSICGFSDWIMNTAKDVTGLSCDFFGNGQAFIVPSAEEKRYGIYQIQRQHGEERLYFGRLTPNENAKFEVTRPTTLDPRFYTRSSRIFTPPQTSE